MKVRTPKSEESASTHDWKAQRKFDDATKWMMHLDQAPRFAGKLDAFSADPYAAALRSVGDFYVGVMIVLAKLGQLAALRELVATACKMAEAIETIAAKNAPLLHRWAERRADWPVMVSRHEVSSKAVAFYLDSIELGTKCLINASGKRVTKYSLRTPINHFVWRTLKHLPSSIDLSDVPTIAAIDLDSLPKLTKTTASIWADRALMPYITAMYEDFSCIPEFTAILRRRGAKTRGQQRREIRKDIIRALTSLAPGA